MRSSLLAGLISEQQNGSRNGIPLLDEIQGLGDAFSHQDKKGTRTELIIFIRPQIIREHSNPLFAGILRRFRDTTGLPVLINTSFNVHEEPIVNRPEECLQALQDDRVDFVVTQQAVYVAR